MVLWSSDNKSTLHCLAETIALVNVAVMVKYLKAILFDLQLTSGTNIHKQYNYMPIYGWILLQLCLWLKKKLALANRNSCHCERFSWFLAKKCTVLIFFLLDPMSSLQNCRSIDWAVCWTSVVCTVTTFLTWVIPFTLVWSCLCELYGCICYQSFNLTQSQQQLRKSIMAWREFDD